MKIRRLINKITDGIRESYEISGPIEDMTNIVKLMEGEVAYSNDLKYDGRIEKVSNENIEFRILLPMSTSEIRDRFTIAHELGHLFLHMGYKLDDSKWKTVNPSVVYNRDNHATEREYQANEFAASFLMPEEEFIAKLDELKNQGKVPMDKVAEYFNVSLEAAINRGRWLGYLEW